MSTAVLAHQGHTSELEPITLGTAWYKAGLLAGSESPILHWRASVSEHYNAWHVCCWA